MTRVGLSIFRSSLGRWVLTGLVAVGALLGVTAPAQAATTATTTCTATVDYQPFLPWNDSNWYSLLPGESYDELTGTGWTLTGGASTVTTTVADGTVGTVLNLPKGSKAVTPPICLNNTYPYMRMMLHSIAGGSVSFSISYLQTNGTWKAPQSTGSATTPASSWVLTGPVSLASGPYTGWNLGQLTFTGGGTKTTSDSQIYNVYADPRMKH